MTGIYGLRNTINGKWYIGQSSNVHNAWIRRYKNLHCKKQTKLYNALKKYGYDAFDKILLEECLDNAFTLDTREDWWIRHYSSVENGYNCKYGGAHGKMSEEAKQKIKDWCNLPQNKNRLSNWQKVNGHPWFGRKHSKASCIKMAAADRAGSKSPSFGRMWINNGTDNKKIMKNDPMPIGYKKGRLIKISLVKLGAGD